MTHNRHEVMPLLHSSSSRYDQHQYPEKTRQTQKDNQLWSWISEDDDETILFADNKKRGTSSVINDTFILIIWSLQIFCVLQSLGLRWPFPESWLRYSRFVFFCNLDVWEFMKLNNNETYTSLREYYTPSASVGFNYWWLLVGWGGLISVLFLIYVITYSAFSHKRSPFMLVKIARLQRAFVIITQLLSIPYGITIYRVFHCNSDNQVDVANEYTCFAGTHWAILAPGVTFSLVIYILFPIWLILKTKEELLSMNSDRHEGYLQLKETEFVHGLDVQWIVGNFYIFSSFKKYGAHFHAAMQFLNALIIVCYAGFFRAMFAGAVLINVILFVMFITFIVLRPFRVTCFNVYLILSLLCLNLDCMMGVLVTSFDSYSLQTVWLTPYYLTIILVIINAFWVAVTVVWVLYVAFRACGCCDRCCGLPPLWPAMSSVALGKLSVRTREYVKSVIVCKLLIEKCLSMTYLFAPAHELARQIHIVNAYCREAEFLRDPLQHTLWDLLDELIEAHTKVAPKSLFAESVKDSIRHTASEFMKLMPAFKKRLNQREYDFILFSTKKKRILLKMYCMGLFLNGRRIKVERSRLSRPALRRVWHRNKDEEVFDDGYYEDMYPEVEPGPSQRPDTLLSRQILSAEQEEALYEAETEDHTVQSGSEFINLAFLQEEELSDEERDTRDLESMMADVPSRPTTADTNRSVRAGSGFLSPPPPPYHPHRPSSAGSNRPGSSAGSNRPGSSAGFNRPGSSASQRSHRPGSAQSADLGEHRSTPIPGQVDTDHSVV